MKNPSVIDSSFSKVLLAARVTVTLRLVKLGQNRAADLIRHSAHYQVFTMAITDTVRGKGKIWSHKSSLYAIRLWHTRH